MNVVAEGSTPSLVAKFMPYKDPAQQKAYNKRYLKQHYKDNKQYYIDKKNARHQDIRNFITSLKTKCTRCNENHPAALDFHHRDRTQKDLCVSDIVTFGWSKARIKSEIDKCDILCANCHRKEHNTYSSESENTLF